MINLAGAAGGLFRALGPVRLLRGEDEVDTEEVDISMQVFERVIGKTNQRK